MKIETNLDDYINRLERFKAALQNGSPIINDAIFGGLNTGVGLLKRRIFNAGHNEDADGIDFGKYTGKKTKLTKRKFSINNDDVSDAGVVKKLKTIRKGLVSKLDGNYTEYEKKRLAHGRQIEHKDLEFDGTLRRSIETEIFRHDDRNKVVVVIGNDETAKIARYQEQQIGNIRAGLSATKGAAIPARIFEFSQSEIEQVIEETNISLGVAIKQIFDDTK